MEMCSEMAKHFEEHLRNAAIQRKNTWDNFLMRLDRIALVHGSRGAAIRYLLRNSDVEDQGEYDFIQFCFLLGLDHSFAGELRALSETP